MRVFLLTLTAIIAVAAFRGSWMNFQRQKALTSRISALESQQRALCAIPGVTCIISSEKEPQ